MDMRHFQACHEGTRGASLPRSGQAAVRPRTTVASSSQHAPSSEVPARRLSFLDTLEQFVSPKKYAEKILKEEAFAWGKTGLLPSKDTLFVADVEAARSLLAFEMQLGIGGDWLNTIRAMMGPSSVAMTEDLELHARLRQIMGASFTKEAINQALPELQQTASRHLSRWASATSLPSSSTGSTGSTSVADSLETALTRTPDGSMVLGYPAVRLLTFDVLVNCVMGLDMTDAEVQQYAQLFKTLVNGFAPPAFDLPFTAFGKGLRAREQLVQRIQQALRGPQCKGTLARLRDEFGADSAVAVDNTMNLLFAGFDTTSSSISYMLWLLAQYPEVQSQVAAEQDVVLARFGPVMTAEAYQQMPYATAVVKEALRVAHIISYVPRKTTRQLSIPRGPTVPAGCPFVVALSAISDADPVLQSAGDVHQFKPERWLDPAAAKSLPMHQLPFGTGQRTCLGMNLAYAEMVTVLAQLGRSYVLTADWQGTEWKDFPIKQPENGLPLRLTARQ